MVPKGSVAIEGISLTIAAVTDEEIAIAILPLTYWRTNLHTLAIGAPVNIEADVLVKLAAMQMQVRAKVRIRPDRRLAGRERLLIRLVRQNLRRRNLNPPRLIRLRSNPRRLRPAFGPQRVDLLLRHAPRLHQSRAASIRSRCSARGTTE